MLQGEQFKLSFLILLLLYTLSGAGKCFSIEHSSPKVYDPIMKFCILSNSRVGTDKWMACICAVGRFSGH